MRSDVSIQFISGKIITANLKNFKVWTGPDGKTNFSWEREIPGPLMLNENNIEAIWVFSETPEKDD